MSIAAQLKADLIGAMAEQGQTASIAGGAALRCIAEFPREARDASDLGFMTDSDLRLTVLDADYPTLPELGDAVVFKSVTYRISEMSEDGFDVSHDLNCVRD